MLVGWSSRSVLDWMVRLSVSCTLAGECRDAGEWPIFVSITHWSLPGQCMDLLVW